VDLWFTDDGSGFRDCFGAGIYGPLYNYNRFTATLFSVGKRTHQESFGTEASGQVGCQYWLPIVQNADEIPSA
jgi:hypothetical protein